VINGSPQEASTEVRGRTSTTIGKIETAGFETFNRYIRKMLLVMVDRDEMAGKRR
jgi:hypothetical protein